ncbi:MAG TPA: carboxypeptidase-like regulatory domain-containing protein [Niastella sp.]
MPTSLKLHIPEPCHENWQNMTQQAQGRFCGSCQKTVVDFSVMTDKEILEYFSKTSQHVCGRFSNDQLNKDLKVTDKKKRFSLAYVWNIILATLLMTEANAQVKPKPKKPVKINMLEKRMVGQVAFVPEAPVETVIPVTMSGTIVDAQNNQPVVGASISIKGASGGTMADTSGIFRLKVEKKNSLVLEISAIGYETQTRAIDRLTNWQAIQVYLKPAANELQEVVIRGYTMGKRSMQGCNGVRVKKDTIKSVIINNYIPAALKTALQKDVKIYPNPVVRGNPIQVKLALPKTGGYKLELLNTAGQVMMVQPLLIQTKEQQIDLYTQANWSAGIYWVRISSPDTKNVFQGKVLVK